MIIKEGYSYIPGELYNLSGALALEFPWTLNPDLHGTLSALGLLVGKEADAAGLPDFVIIDGVRYDIVYEEDDPDYGPLLDAIATVLQDGVANPPYTAIHAKELVRNIVRLLRIGGIV